ncbi:MAG: alanine racemase [Proteobacteria bacterium]|nr:alanine racemase [Pseudomonadota bacterium]MBI3499960.1 alanine racemase [Pseudomonadota bacterium]
MNDFIRSIDDIRLDARTKGLPLAEGEIRLGDVGKQGWNVLKGDMTLPLLTLSDAAVANNLKVMREFIEASGVSIAPHGKATGCPQLYRLQLEEGGAWGMTAATGPQAILAARSGAPHVLIANELVSPANIRQLVGLQKAFPKTRFYSLVDSADGVRRLAEFARPALEKGQRLAVLIELGAAGGRAGARNRQAAELVLAALGKAGEVLELAGVECYEGAVSREGEVATLAAIGELLEFAMSVYEEAARQGFFAGLGETLISAGGTIYFDEVVRRFARIRATPGLRIVLRGGAYLALDHGFYLRNAKAMDRRGQIAGRSGPKPPSEAFRPALALWAAVLSLQDPGTAIMNMGMRDLPYDIDLPIPLKHYREGRLLRDIQASNAPWKVVRANDQHCFLSYPEGSDIATGDVLAFGISHTSTAFDKWSVLYRIDESATVTGALKTFF